MITARRSAYFLPMTIIADTICMNIAFFLSYFIRFESLQGVVTDDNLLLFWVFNASWFLLLLVVKPYREPRITFNISKLTYNLLFILAIHAAIIAFFWAVTQGYSFSRLRLGIIYIIAAFLGILLRITGVYTLRALRKRGYNIRTFLVVGYGELSHTIVDYYTQHPEMGYVFKGYFSENPPNKQDHFDSRNLEKILRNETIDYIYCCSPYLSTEQLGRIISISQENHANVKLLMDFRGFVPKGISVEYHDYLPIISVSPQPHFDAKAMFVKRTFDVFFSSVIMLLGVPIFLVVALVTKLTSPGPVFYKSERVGMWGRKFQMIKFRSMYINADEIAEKLLGGDKHSIGEHDPRVTPWGKLMRKTRLDELPQFLNVLLGNMSVVGPRPLPQYDVDMIMEASPDKFMRLLSVKPGITSIGQLHFGYASTQQQNVQRMNYDLLYLKKYSLRRDVWLIYLTARVMLASKGR